MSKYLQKTFQYSAVVEFKKISFSANIGIGSEKFVQPAIIAGLICQSLDVLTPSVIKENHTVVVNCISQPSLPLVFF